MTLQKTQVVIDNVDANGIEAMINNAVESAISKNSTPANCLILRYDQLPDKITPQIYRLLTGKSRSTYARHIEAGLLKVSQVNGGKNARLYVRKGDFIKYLETLKVLKK